MSKEVMKLALEALEYIHEGANNQGPHTGISWRCVSKKAAPVITALRQALANEALANEALDKKAENARELGLDYEPVPEKFMDALKFDVAMREALAEQPAQQEPFGYFRYDLRLDAWVQNRAGLTDTPFYTSPPAQQGRVAWTLLLTGENQGLVGKAGEKFVGAPEYYERVDVYTSLPAQRKPLTGAEIRKWWSGENGLEDCRMAKLDDFEKVVRAIEAAHGIKENI